MKNIFSTLLQVKNEADQTFVREAEKGKKTIWKLIDSKTKAKRNSF